MMPMGMGAIAPMVPTTHPRKADHHRHGKDLSSPESRGLQSNQRNGYQHGQKTRNQVHYWWLPRIGRAVIHDEQPPLSTFPASRIICINATGIMITTILHKMSDNALLVLVRRRFQFVPWCSILQAAAASSPTPMDK